MRRQTEKEVDIEKLYKPRPDLLPARALLAAGEVMGYGYRKHGNCTWRVAGTEQAKPETHTASALRHLLEHLADPRAVEEGSGLPVLWHAMSQIAIAIDCIESAKQARKAARGGNGILDSQKLADRVREIVAQSPGCP